MSKKIPDTMIPARAMPLPLNLPWLRLIWDIAKAPKINPINAVKPQVKTPRMPRINEETAMPLVLAGPADAAGNGGSTPDKAARAASASANSGNVASGRYSASPSALTWDCEVSRPSAIQWRMLSAVTRPYCFWSPPMMV